MGAPSDIVDLKVSEEQAEMRDAGALVGIPGVTGESSRPAVRWTIIGTIVGAVLLLPLAAIPLPDTTVMARALIALVTGAFAGSTVGFVAGGALGAKVSSRPMAADQGVVVAVDLPAADGRADDEVVSDDDLRDQVLALMVAEAPIRVDHVGPDGSRLATLATEGDDRTGPARMRRAYLGHDDPQEITLPEDAEHGGSR